MKSKIYKCLILMFALFSVNLGYAQISLANTTPVVENFNSMNAGTTMAANWRMHAGSSPTWATATTTGLAQASSGAPTTGSRYNWGTTGGTDRALGIMTSGSFASPNSVLVSYRNMNAANLTQLSVSYDLERYRINTAAASVQFYYSLDGSTWNGVSSGDISTSTIGTGTNAYSYAPQATFNVNSFNITGLNIPNGSDIYLRWNLNTTGSNSQGIGIDNVSVTAAFASGVNPTKLAITSITPTSPTAGNGFNVTVFAQDAGSTPANVVATTTVTLSNTNGGTIGGTTTGVITAGTNSVVISGVTLSSASTNVTLTGTASGGDVLTPATSSTFTVLAAASQLAFVSIPSTATVGSSLSSFTVEARRPDASVDNTYTGNVTITKTSGPGTLSGTTTVAAVAGVATFSDLSFNQTGSYTLNATSGSLSPSTSGTITVDNHLVISQVYGGGGNSGATYRNDFIELYNPTNSTVSLSTYSIQYASTSGSTWTKNNLAGSIAPGKYFLIQGASGGANGATLPTADQTISTDLAGANGKIALVGNTSTLSGTCPSGLVDFVGYGTANCFEGTAAVAALSVTTSGKRIDNGCTDTDQNSSDFSTGTPTPRNSASPFWSCTCVTPSVFTVTGGGSYCTGGSGLAVGLSGSESGNSYQLYLNGSIDGSPVAGTGSAISFGTKTAAGTYSVVATYPAASCTANMTGSTTISINALPAVSISGNNDVCNGSSVVLTASGASTYSWSSGDNTTTSTVSPTTTTTYTVTGTDVNGCVNTATKMITVNELPNVTLSGTSEICQGTSTTLTASGADTYVWSSGGTNASETITPSFTQTYTVTGTDLNGCSYAVAQLITLYDLPEVIIGGNTTIVNGTSTTLTGNGADTYVWNTGATTTAITVSPTATTSYTVTGTNSTTGCFASNSVTVTVTPPVSPNGDGSSSVTPTSLRAAYCATNVSTLGTYLYSTAVTSATNYEYKFTESGTTFAYFYTRGSANTNVYLANVAGLQYGKTYDVQVRAYVGGVWGVFGSTCTATITNAPSTKIRTQYCGANLTSLGTSIYCDGFLNATRYRFHIIDLNLSTDYFYTSNGSNTTFIPQWIPQMTYGGNYSIEVAMELSGTFGPYGPACGLTIAGVPNTQIRTNYCNHSAPTTNTAIYCDPVTSATAYEYEITNLTTPGVIFHTRTGGNTAFYPHLVPGIVNNAAYSIRVRAICGAASGSFGSACSLTLGVPGARIANPEANEVAKIEVSQSDVFTVNVFPNPTYDVLNIKLSESVTAKAMVSDIMGRVVMSFDVTESESQIKTAELAEGTYWLTIVTAEGSSVTKFVVLK